MPKRFIHPIALGGYGTIIITIVIFFAQGGFGDMTPLTSLYIIGLIIGIGLILYSVLKTIPDEKNNTKLDDGRTLLSLLDNTYQRLKTLTGDTIDKLRNNEWSGMQPVYNEAMGLTQMDVNSRIQDILLKGVTDFINGKQITVTEESQQLGNEVLKSPLFTTNPEVIALDASIILRDKIPYLKKVMKRDCTYNRLLRKINNERDKFPNKSVSDAIDAYLDHSIKLNATWVLAERDLDGLQDIEDIIGTQFSTHFKLILKNIPNQMDIEMGQYRNKVNIAIAEYLKEVSK